MYEQKNRLTVRCSHLNCIWISCIPNAMLFFQKPSKQFHPDDHIWFENVPVGHNTLGNVMKNLSKQANLSKMYTNHCIRATATTVLARSGLDVERIKNVTGHRSADSILHYVEGPTDNKKCESSTTLNDFTSGESHETPAQTLHSKQLHARPHLKHLHFLLHYPRPRATHRLLALHPNTTTTWVMPVSHGLSVYRCSSR